MRSPEEILKYIGDFYKHALERPFMYASSPQSLEEKLTTLEQLREFMQSTPSDQHTEGNQYSQFLLANGYGVSLFTSTFYPNHSITDYDKKVFQDFSEFWKRYLASRNTIN